MENSNNGKGSFISKSKAKSEIAAFEKANKNNPKAYCFDKEKILTLLEQQDAEGLRVYLSKDGGGINVVLCAFDGNGNNLVPKGNDITQESSSSDQILNTGRPCPPDCDIDPDTEL